MTDTLTFPEITAPAVAASTQVAAKPASLSQVALSFLTPLEEELAALSGKYQGVAFDLTTPKGLKAAKEARTELRESGRYKVQRLRDQIKDQLNDCKKVVEKEADRLIAIVKPVEDAVHGQIEAHEKRLAEERAERERQEALRRQANLDRIATIRGYVEKAHGVGIERLKSGIAFLEGLDVAGTVDQDFVGQAEQARQDAISQLRKMLADAELDAELKAKREEAERLEREIQERRKQLEAQAAPQPEPVAQRSAPAATAEPAPQEAEAAQPAPEPAPAAFETCTVSAPATLSPDVLKSLRQHEPTPLEQSTAAELRNEWRLFDAAIEFVLPTIQQHAAEVDRIRFLRALDRMRRIFA